MNKLQAIHGQTGGFRKEAWYRLVEPLELVARFAPLDPKTHDSALADDELVADGVDGLTATVFVHRKDRHSAPDAAVRAGEITSAKLIGPDAQYYDLDEDENFAAAPENQGRRRFSIRSKHGVALLNSQQRVGAHMTLRLEGRLNPSANGAKAHRRPAPIAPAEIAVKLRCLVLKFWVVPSDETGLSEAAAFVGLYDKTGGLRPLKGIPLRLWTECDGGMSLTVAPYKGQGGQDKSSDNDGICHWGLAYAGLTWRNLEIARATVNCGVGSGSDPNEWTYFDIVPGENIRSVLQFVVDNTSRLQLVNPYFEPGGGYPWPPIAPEIFRGPAYNCLKMLQTVAEFVESFVIPAGAVDETYVCARLRDRIYEALSDRRFGSKEPRCIEDMEKMNGVEISQYRIRFVHVWAGIHLSGSKPDDDPRFIDPWWRQKWPAANTKPDELMTWSGELENFAASAAAATILGAILIKMLAPYMTYIGLRYIGALSARLGVWVYNIFATEITAGGVGSILAGVEGIGVTGGALLTGSDNEQCRDGIYNGYNASWAKRLAIPHFKQSSTTIVTPFRMGGAP